MALVFNKIWVLCLLLLVLNLSIRIQADLQVPCYFIFGDSLLDDGNNNNLNTSAKANYKPYGIDFPEGPTGRFCNGRNTADFIAQLLGFNHFIPPYATARRQDFLTGVNYASGSSGIRDETGQQSGARISMNEQLRNFQAKVAQLVTMLGNEISTANYLSKCIYTVGMGTNDYISNYFVPSVYPTSQQYTLEQFTDVLIQQYSDQLKTLYNYGARKVALNGLSPLGCTPIEISQNSPNSSSCVERINNATRLFNDRLKSLVDDLNSNLQGARFIYVNAYGIFEDTLKNASSYGFRVTNTACCDLGRNNSQVLCLPLQTPCSNRMEYIYWDAIHPTETQNMIVARRAYNAESSSDAYPIDIRHLAQL